MKVTDASSGSGKWYYYEKNLQGDIVGIMNADGYKVVSYSYDAWGVPYAPVYSTDSVVSAADKANAELNPFRYRGYYYDSETGYYYLQTRYYNPEWGRFINADGYINANGDIHGYNLFAYCFNNPANLNDYAGEWPKWLSGALNIVGGALQVATGAALGATVGWTGLGAVVAGFLVVNGITTGVQGFGQVTNYVTDSDVMREDNLARTGVQELGRIIGGDSAAEIAGTTYDVAVISADIYAGKVILEALMPQIIDSKIFSANNGYGIQIGKSIEILYRNPNAAGGPGGTIFSYKGSLGKFRIDWDPSHGFHSHPPGHH